MAHRPGALSGMAMIEGAEARGELSPGQTVVEYTGGSTGTSLAFVCAVKGYPLRIVSSNAFAEEKLKSMLAFGAELEVIHSDTGIHPRLIPQMQERAAEIVAETGGFPTDQFNNLDTLNGYLGIGTELIDQLGGAIHGAVAFVGVGGAYTGLCRPIRDRWPDVIRIVVEPTESAVISGNPPGTHRIEGGGVGFVPKLITPDSYDRIEAVRLARELWPGHQVVTLQPDSGLKYLSGDLYA